LTRIRLSHRATRALERLEDALEATHRDGVLLALAVQLAPRVISLRIFAHARIVRWIGFLHQTTSIENSVLRVAMLFHCSHRAIHPHSAALQHEAEESDDTKVFQTDREIRGKGNMSRQELTALDGRELMMWEGGGDGAGGGLENLTSTIRGKTVWRGISSP